VPALGGVPLQQLGQPPVLQPAGEAQGRGVVVGRLPVGAEGGGALGGRGGVLQHGRGHARLPGVVGQPRRLVPGHDRQVGQDLAVQLDPPAGGDGPLHRQAGQFVAEAETATLAAEHAGGDALVDGRRVGPVGVLDHRRHHRPATGVEQVQERAEQAVPGRVGGDKGRQLPAGLAGDVEQQHHARIVAPGPATPSIFGVCAVHLASTLQTGNERWTFYGRRGKQG
jgi:hypothetical protein